MNNNVLARISCPECGSVDSFKIYASATFTVHDYGTDHFETVEYNYPELLGFFRTSGIISTIIPINKNDRDSPESFRESRLTHL